MRRVRQARKKPEAQGRGTVASQAWSLPFVVLSNGAILLHSLPVVRHALLDDDLLGLFLSQEPPFDLATANNEGSTLLLETCACDERVVGHHRSKGPSTFQTNRAEVHLKLTEAGSKNKWQNAFLMVLSSPGLPSRFILDFLRQPEGIRQVFTKTGQGYAAHYYALYMLRPNVCD